MQVRILGCSGGIGPNLRTTSLLVNNRLLLDGGTGVGDLTRHEMLSLRHVLLTHAHLDHIAGLALMFASIYDEMVEPITIYAPEDVLATLSEHLFNWKIWPDFTQLPHTSDPRLELKPLLIGTKTTITAGFDVTPITLSHTVNSYAYIIEHNDVKLCFCGDTGTTNKLWSFVNDIGGIDHIIIEASYPNDKIRIAEVSGHYTASLLAQDLKKLSTKPTVHIQHIKPGYEHTVIQQCHDEMQGYHLNILARGGTVDISASGAFKTRKTEQVFNNIEHHLSRLTDIGISLSAEQDNEVLLEKILISAKEIANSDGGTIYTLDDLDQLHMKIVRNDSMNIALGGSSSQQSNFAPLALYLEDGTPNNRNVVTCAIHDDIVIDIKDRHEDTHFDFSGAQAFDDKTGYNSVSFLTIPMKDHKGRMIGALQLINALDEYGDIIPFSHQNSLLVKALASQAAIILTNNKLIDELELLFESFIEMLAGAVDAKSPYTGAHCRRVPELTIMLTNALDATQQGPMKSFSMTEEDRYELKIAAWLHDCGKITTPEYVIDKATKLETIYDRIHEVNARFELVRRDFKIKLLEQKLDAAKNNQEIDDNILMQYDASLSLIEEDQDFINLHNIGQEFMDKGNQDRIIEIAERYEIVDYQGRISKFLSDDEVTNMQISRGTLTASERKVINNHIDVTIDMLTALKLPKHLKNVPEIAGGHHERMDGKGYPKGLTIDQMSVQSRAMGVADIFEALTASDRPYKKAKTLSESLRIMKRMKDTGHIDPDIFNVFIEKKIYLEYANKFLDEQQCDAVDEQSLIE